MIAEFKNSDHILEIFAVFIGATASTHTTANVVAVGRDVNLEILQTKPSLNFLFERLHALFDEPLLI